MSPSYSVDETPQTIQGGRVGMTVKELINKLNKYPDNFLVLMFDAESDIGYTAVSDIIRGVNEFDGCIFIDKSE